LPIPSRRDLEYFYHNYSDIRAADDVVKLNAERNISVLKGQGYSSECPTLDFGTGDGSFVQVAGINCYGIDFKPSPENRVYTNYSEVPVKSFDFVTMWGVLEHLADPVATVKELVKVLNDGGKLILTTVNAEGVIPYYYKPIEHLTYWTAPAFRHLFDQCGLRLVHSEPYFMVQRSAVYLDRLLSRTPAMYKDAFQAAMGGLPDYVEVPTNEVLCVAELN
jgi:SAM-dependent methyltransferase